MPSGIWSRVYRSFPSALNTWLKVCPWILIWAFAPISGQQISILDPPPLHWTFWPVLVWTFTLWVNLGEGAGWGVSIRSPDNFFVADGEKRDYLSCASRALLRGGATKNTKAFKLAKLTENCYPCIIIATILWSTAKMTNHHIIWRHISLSSVIHFNKPPVLLLGMWGDHCHLIKLAQIYLSISTQWRIHFCHIFKFRNQTLLSCWNRL